METGKAVRTIRGARKLKQESLAIAAGLGAGGATYLSRLENGVIARPRIEKLIAIASALRVPVDLLAAPPTTADRLLQKLREIDAGRSYEAPTGSSVQEGQIAGIPVSGRVVYSPPSAPEGRIPVLRPEQFKNWDWEDFDFVEDQATDHHLPVMPGSHAFFVVARGPELTGTIPPLEDDGAAVHIHEGMLLQTIPRLRPPGRHPVIAKFDFGPGLRIYVPYEEGGPKLLILGAHQQDVDTSPRMFPMVAALHRFVRL